MDIEASFINIHSVGTFALVAQLVEYILGKDGVPSSNLGGSLWVVAASSEAT